MDNLKLAHKMASKDKSFYKEVKAVNKDLDAHLQKVQELLLTESYEVSPYECKTINDNGKERLLQKLPYFPDRIIQWAIMLQVEPVFMEAFCYHTCASLKDRGINRAANLTRGYMDQDPDGTMYCLKVDVHHFYPSIDHQLLKELLLKKFKDEQLLRLLFRIIDSTQSPVGVPIGSYLSQFFGNFYLCYVDHWLKETMHQKYCIRYMDDIVVLSGSKEELHGIRKKLDEYLHSTLHLELKANYQIFPVDSRGVDFVGYRFFHGYALMRKRCCNTMKKKMVAIKEKQDRHQLINYSEFCSISSYDGELKMCNSYRLRDKYIVPVLPSKERYYKEVIRRKKKGEKP